MVTLNNKVFFNAQEASAATAWYPLDFRHSDETNRTIIVTMDHIAVSGAAEVIIEGRVLARGREADTSAAVITTIKVHTSASTLSFNLTQPFTDIRIRKTGATGTVNVHGIV